jgi:hypothetical protein
LFSTNGKEIVNVNKENLVDAACSRASEIVLEQISLESVLGIQERYRALEKAIALSMTDALCECLGKDRVDPKLIAKKVESVSSLYDSYVDSQEFVTPILSNYARILRERERLHEEKRRTESENSMSKEIDDMAQLDLVVAIARAHGVRIIDHKHPCRVVSGEIICSEYFSDFSDNYPGDIIEWPVTLIMDGTSRLDPIVDYPGNTMNALCLISDLKALSFTLETRESIVTGKYTCSFMKKEDDGVVTRTYSGTSTFLAEAISKAYLKAFLFSVNPLAQRRVFSKE